MKKKKKNSPQTAQKGAPKWKGAPSRTAPGSRGGTGREGLLGWRYCRDPSATHRKKRGSGVGMTNAEGRWMLAAFACVAFADGVGRRPLQKQANPRENPHPLKSKGAAPASPREGYRKGWHTEEKRGRFVWWKKRWLAAALQVTSFWGRACRLGRHRGGGSRPGRGPGNF